MYEPVKFVSEVIFLHPWCTLTLAGRVPPREPPREMATGGRRGDGAARSAAAAAAVAAAGPAAICNGLGEPLSASLRARARAAPAWLSMLATIPVAMPRACPVNLCGRKAVECVSKN